MSSTEGLNNAITGSMSSRSTASTGVSAVSNPEILGNIQSIRSTETRNTASIAVYTPEILPVLLKYSSCSPRKWFALTSTRGTVCEIFLQRNGMELSKRCGNGRTITHSPSILRIFRDFLYREYSKVWAARDPETLPSTDSIQEYRTPIYFTYRE